MGIDKINPVNNNDYVKINKKENVNNGNVIEVKISDAALDKMELNRIMEIVKSVPDVRADKVLEIKKKLEDPNYLNDRISETAKRIMDSKIIDSFDT